MKCSEYRKEATVITDDVIANIIDSVTEYVYCNYEKCHMIENDVYRIVSLIKI